MTQHPDRLYSIRELQVFIEQNVGDIVPVMAKQLSDTMRENERLRDFIEHWVLIMADGGCMVDATLMKNAARKALEKRNKDSDNA
jgi:hypothetical protein